MIVTTSREPTPQQVLQAERIAGAFSVTFVPWQESRQVVQRDRFVVQRDRVVFKADEYSLRYHPGMAMVRLRRLKAGARDRMLDAMDLGFGDSVLDCTLGLGQDALVASWGAGPPGTVVGLEGSLPVAVITVMGLQDYPFAPDFAWAARRIQARWQRWQAALQQMPDNAYDVVYFDPMFESGIPQSSGIASLRPYALLDDLDRWAVRQAVRVARRRVVLKARRGSPMLEELGFRLADTSRNPVQYGVIRVDGTC